MSSALQDHPSFQTTFARFFGWPQKRASPVSLCIYVHKTLLCIPPPRARQRKRERANQQPPKNTTAADKGDNSGSMQVPEDTNSRSSVEGQTGSPRNHADHLSDTQESWASKEILDSDSSDSGREEKSDIEDFQAQLNQELNRQAASREAKGGGEDVDAVTLDDVLDIGVDEEFID